MKTVKIEEFGKDHWSLLAYLETLQVDNQDAVGEINRNKLSCNEKEHPMLRSEFSYDIGWKDSYSTRIKDGKTVPGHDDWHSLDDLEKAGLITIISLIDGFFKLTDKGIAIAGQIRSHKAHGGV